VKKLTAEPLNTALAKEALLSSFTVAASAPAMLTGNLTEGKGLLTGTILACDDGQPIRLGNLSIRYEEALGAITERV